MFSFLFRKSRKAADWVPDPARQLTIYIGWPLESSTEWKRVNNYDAHQLNIDGQTVKPADVRSYLLAYPNHEAMGGANLFYPLPAGLKFLEPKVAGGFGPRNLDSAQTELGKATCIASHSRFRTDAERKKIYATTLKNISKQPVRIQKFAGFLRARGGYVLSTVTGTYYSAEQFRAWYATAPDGWIMPGDQVTDDSNYGRGYGIWAYFGETKDGNYFVTVVPLPT